MNFLLIIFKKQYSISLGILRHVYEIPFSQNSKMCFSNDNKIRSVRGNEKWVSIEPG